MTDSKGMSFGVRKTYIATENRKGVRVAEMVPEPLEEGEALQDTIVSNMKYKAPSILTLTHGGLTEEMIQLLDEYMDPAEMNEETTKYWRMLREGREGRVAPQDIPAFEHAGDANHMNGLLI